MSDTTMKRANWIGAPAYYELNEACRTVAGAFGHHIYLVGSVLTTRDYRDVDVRCILDDDKFASLFGVNPSPSVNPMLSLLTVSISRWLSDRSGLPVDFQFQRQTDANAGFSIKAGHMRHAIGLFYDSPLYEKRENEQFVAALDHLVKQAGVG